MSFKLTPPLVYDRHSGNGRSITQRAESASQHVLRQVLDIVDVFLQTAAVMETDQRFLQPICSFSTGNTPAAALVLVELHDPQRELHHAGLIVDHDHTAGAKGLSSFAEGVE